jgi:hypothetical protein
MENYFKSSVGCFFFKVLTRASFSRFVSPENETLSSLHFQLVL